MESADVTLAPAVMTTRVQHKRFAPKSNAFAYKLAYLCLPLGQIDSLSALPWFATNRRALMSFWNKDHGSRQGADLRDWASEVLHKSGVEDVDGEILLVTLPRLLGYVFNPVSFWLCHRQDGQLRAVIAEVNNTFGETHVYVCAHDDGSSVLKSDCFYAPKEFHVSPFFQRDGHYRFRFLADENQIRIHIDYFDEHGDPLLVTSIAGRCHTWSKTNLLKAWLTSPLMSLKAIALIHWQALKLLVKSARYQKKPEQHNWHHTSASSHPPLRSSDTHVLRPSGFENTNISNQ